MYVVSLNVHIFCSADCSSVVPEVPHIIDNVSNTAATPEVESPEDDTEKATTTSLQIHIETETETEVDKHKEGVNVVTEIEAIEEKEEVVKE